MDRPKLNEVDRIEILALEDNYINVILRDNSDIVARPPGDKDGRMADPVLAEHGFSALIKTTTKKETKTMIFDFGFSRDVVVRNAGVLGVDLTDIEAAALSHGHLDHFGGLDEVAGKIAGKGVEFVVHPSAFRPNRYIFRSPDNKVTMPSPEREKVRKAGFKIVETQGPYQLMDGDALFLGEVPRRTSFEKGAQKAFYVENGQAVRDIIEEDTSLVMNVKGKGLVILSGCAHSGIINTVEYARETTGIKKVHVVMGGFHLSGPDFESIIDDTVKSMKEIGPDYIIPAHCTGTKAALAFEKAMPNQFILSMSGTKWTFAA
jgi:7,8-dihydropterin-6-yl-methyl-4-(beta-D-ribofuranosyl)aminobenzene 5'-phosphate synthase